MRVRPLLSAVEGPALRICRRGRLGRNERVGRASQNARGGIALQVRNSQREAALALARFENLRRLALSRVEGPALSGIEGLDSRDERHGPAGRQVERQLARAEEVLDALEPERDVPRVLEAVIPERFRLDLSRAELEKHPRAARVRRDGRAAAFAPQRQVGSVVGARERVGVAERAERAHLEPPASGGGRAVKRPGVHHAAFAARHEQAADERGAHSAVSRVERLRAGRHFEPPLGKGIGAEPHAVPKSLRIARADVLVAGKLERAAFIVEHDVKPGEQQHRPAFRPGAGGEQPVLPPRVRAGDGSGGGIAQPVGLEPLDHRAALGALDDRRPQFQQRRGHFRLRSGDCAGHTAGRQRVWSDGRRVIRH